ncbi:adenylyl-sulfate kinase [Cellulomonas fengjieae]|uniref:Adenylyl-sulfate kinase n=1 Tax=Cellulomonas fengjieae TaxID=2819978 RepID=A0ABS3SK06_9CELL|nr:adenylyl-sulfate kinase [Cellulomonas fengjieae]MBO3086082.1 adenylyl-sulfate kinase [Cellulomonas fengjieae]QVI65852.1 adenylyl-sulfate kinase [Cellulomonas fengjieae]
MDVVVLSGTVGAGKTTIALALRDALVARGLSAIDVDVDAVAQETSAAPDDPFNERAVVAHLRSMREHWREAGIDVLLLPRVVETVGQRDACADALGEPVRVVRIDADSSTRHARLISRHEPGPDRDWHLARTDVLADLLVAASVEDLVVVNDGRPATAAALEIVDLLRLPARA